MQQLSPSSPELERGDEDHGRDERVSRSVSSSAVGSTENGPTTFLSAWNRNLPPEEPPPGFEFRETARQAEECKAYYHAFDAVREVTLTDDMECELASGPHALKFIKHWDDGKCEHDVSYNEDRAVLQSHMFLSALRSGNVKTGLRGHVFIRNRCGLNLAFFIKSSSPAVHVKETINWILPKGSFKVHCKMYTEYKAIANEFLLIYFVPIYFRKQLDFEKLKYFWRALGTPLNPVEHTECHRVDAFLLSPKLTESYSIMDRTVHEPPKRPFQGLVLLEPSNQEKIHVPNYAEFWDLKEDEMAVALKCYSREQTRALRRKILKDGKAMKTLRQFLCAGIGLVVGTGMVYGFSTGFLQTGLPWKAGVAELATPLLEQFFFPQPTKNPQPIVQEEPPDPTWRTCFDVGDPEPRWNAYLISRCLFMRTLNTIWRS